jgi:hypothetical protein
MIMVTNPELELLRETVKTWLVLLSNDQEGDFSEALDLTLAAGEILKIKKGEMDEILARG